MKVNLFILIIISLLLSSCSNENEKASNTSESIPDTKMEKKSNTTFDTYLKKIPFTKLPLELKCEKQLKGSTFDFDSSVISKYGKENSTINGKISENENFTAIIYLYPADIILPVIQTTDRKGNKISELQVYDKWCGEDEFSWGASWATITKDLIITLSDSAIIYKRDSEGEIIENSKTTEVRHRKFVIDKNGKILEE